MKITLLSDEAIRLEPLGPGMTIEAESAIQQYSPFHMLASSLAYCTWSVLASWATHADIPTDDLTVDVRWAFTEKPHRVGSLAVDFRWPSLPGNRREAARRAAELCAVHATLTHPPAITIAQREVAGPGAPTPAFNAALGGAAR